MFLCQREGGRERWTDIGDLVDELEGTEDILLILFLTVI